MQYPFITISSRSTLARIGSTRYVKLYGQIEMHNHFNSLNHLTVCKQINDVELNHEY